MSGTIARTPTANRRPGDLLPYLKAYRWAWLAAVVIALLTLIALRPTHVPALSDEPTSFDGQRARADLATLANDFPKRVAGSDASDRAMRWVVQQLGEMGLEPHVDPFVARIEGEQRLLQNLWAESQGETQDAIIVVANRDSPPSSTQGADNNASGVAALLELARVFSLQSHAHKLIFLWSDGDAYGALGTHNFLEAHPEITVRAAIALRQVGLARARAIQIEGWGATDSVAPPWLWALASEAAEAEGRLSSPLPNVMTQMIRLALPVGGGSQAPFVAAGVPAITLRADGPRPSADLDTIDAISTSTLQRLGRTAERIVASIDQVRTDLPGCGSAIFFSRHRALPGAAVTLALLALLWPLVVVTARLERNARRERRSLGPALLLYLLRVAPWFVMLIVVYIANLTTLLPRSSGAAFAPDSRIAHSPHYVRAFFLLLILVALVLYAHAVERRLVRHTPVAPMDTVRVVHLALLAVAMLVLLINPFGMVVLLPAAVLWPLARVGPWPVSHLPALLGLSGVAIALAYVAIALGLGLHAWWYLLLLIENRTVPFAASLAGICFVAAAIHLGHHLYRREHTRPPIGDRGGVEE